MTEGSITSGSAGAAPPGSRREILREVVRYWELRRMWYNAALVAVVLAWLVLTWPHFRVAMRPQALLFLLVSALLANVCYCAGYLADVPMQLSSLRPAWRRWRWSIWLSGTLFAVLLANYWIADEIYPYVH